MAPEIEDTRLQIKVRSCYNSVLLFFYSVFCGFNCSETPDQFSRLTKPFNTSQSYTYNAHPFIFPSVFFSYVGFAPSKLNSKANYSLQRCILSGVFHAPYRQRLCEQNATQLNRNGSKNKYYPGPKCNGFSLQYRTCCFVNTNRRCWNRDRQRRHF